MPEEQKQSRPKPTILVVLDGWGVAPSYSGNAIAIAKTPNFDGLIAKYPVCVLSASGEAVGLPWGEIGNSEVGHMNLGAGRIIYQTLPRINKAISDGSFFQNKTFLGAVNHVQQNNSSLHIMGLLSDGGVHSAMEHLISLLALAGKNKIKKVYLHMFLDGRDTAYNSSREFIDNIDKYIAKYKIGQIASLSGRFYAMDRDNHWDRIEQAYIAMTEGKCKKTFSTAKESIDYYHGQKVYDEEFTPTVITNKSNQPVGIVEDKDAVIFFNFRADRAREMTKAFVLPSFDKFKRNKECKDLFFVTMVEYEKKLPVEIAFPPQDIENTIGQVLSESGLKQLRIAETEKYAHVTYFFNGGKEQPVEGEDKAVIPSPNVESYAQKPEMSAAEITARLKKEISGDKYDFILVNYANPDMVGHTGNLQAAIKAIEFVDKIIDELVKIVLSADGVIMFVADHGNAEEMFNMQTGSINKEHTTNPVPFIIVGNDYEGKSIGSDVQGGDLSLLQPRGILSDVAPTVLKIMGLKKPLEMTGRTLI